MATTRKKRAVSKTRKSRGTATRRVAAKPKAGPVTGAAAERQLKSFIAKFEPRLQRLIRATRRGLRKRLPGANELVWDNYNFFVIGYSPSERPYDSALSLAAAANGVGLAFLQGATLPDPAGILRGSGKQNRFVRLESEETLDLPAVGKLIDAAITGGKLPYPKAGGRVIIRSISAKQRPRRRSGA